RFPDEAGQKPPEEPPGEKATDESTYGLALRDSPAAQAPEGALVESVQPGSPAAEAGLQPGDLIIEIDRERVGGAAEAQHRLDRQDRGQRHLVRAVRDGSYFFTVLAAP